MNGKHCSTGELHLLIDGALSRARGEEVTAHLRSCAGCASRHRMLARFDSAVRSLPLSLAGPDFTGRVMASLDHLMPAPRAFRFFTWMACQVGFLIVLALMAGVFILTGVIQPEQLTAGNSVAGNAFGAVDGVLSSLSAFVSASVREFNPAAHAGSFLIAFSAAVVVLLLALLDRNFNKRSLQRSR